MPLPKHIFDPPFQIVRSSHVVLDVTDLDRSLAFYEGTLGLIVEDRTRMRSICALSKSGSIIRWCCVKAPTAACERIGFKVGSEEELDKAAAFFKARGLRHAFVEVPYQGRTLHVTDPFGMQIELYFKMEKRERLLQLYGRYHGVHAQRLDHFNVFSPELQDAVDFYALLGFRMTEYTEEDGADGRIIAAWMHRKGNVHDLAFTNGRGPRLHHLAYWVPSPLNIIHLCDVMASTGYLGKHGARAGPARHFQRVLPLRARSGRTPHGILCLRLPDHGPRSRRDPLVGARPAPADAVGPARAAHVVRGRLGVRRHSRCATRCSRPT